MRKLFAVLVAIVLVANVAFAGVFEEDEDKYHTSRMSRLYFRNKALRELGTALRKAETKNDVNKVLSGKIERPFSKTKRWDFYDNEGNIVSTIFERYQNDEWHREKVFKYKDGDENSFTRKAYNKRLPNGTYDYDRIEYYNDDGTTINFIHKYSYDERTSRREYIDNYEGSANDNYITHTTYYGYTEDGRRHRDKVVYYNNGQKNDINYIDYYDENSKYLYRLTAEQINEKETKTNKYEPEIVITAETAEYIEKSSDRIDKMIKDTAVIFVPEMGDNRSTALQEIQRINSQ